jgi:hypothetical protein
MNSFIHDTALIISSQTSRLNATSLLGTGGWLPPHEREVLDWITLINWMGWKFKLLHPEEFDSGIINTCGIKWIILTDDPDELDAAFTERLFEILENHPVLIVSGSGRRGSHFSDRFGAAIAATSAVVNKLEWTGVSENKSWTCRKDISINALECRADIEPLVTANGNVLVAVNKKAAGNWVVLSFHPGAARDMDGSFTSLIMYILIYQSSLPVAWFDFENTLVLRMDDPGSSEMVHHSIYQNTKLTEADWIMIGEELQKRNARMTLGYVPGWTDDGNDKRGELFIDGKKTAGSAGKIYPSPLVKYQSLQANGENKVFDYESEFRGIQQLRNKDLVDVELHGYTHIHPDKEAWINAPDKYENKIWYREFGKNTIDYIKKRPVEEHPFELGLKAFQEIFQTNPSTLICPGDEFTNDVLLKAVEAGLMFVSSYYLAVRIDNRLCWDQYVCAPYLDNYDPSWFDAGLPVVGYFHDFDVSIHGIKWFALCLDAWQKAGANFFMDFRELSNIVSHTISISGSANQYQLNVFSENNPPFIKPVRIGIHIPGKKITLNLVLNNNQKNPCNNVY